MKNNDLVAAKLCYNEALNYMLSRFESLKENLLAVRHFSDKIKCLSEEIAMIFGNRSLVMLKETNFCMAISDAQQSLKYFPTAKVHM